MRNREREGNGETPSYISRRLGITGSPEVNTKQLLDKGDFLCGQIGKKTVQYHNATLKRRNSKLAT